jgi:hypothetical protein
MALQPSPLNLKQLCVLLVLTHGMAQQHHVNVTALEQVLLQGGGHNTGEQGSDGRVGGSSVLGQALYRLAEPMLEC